LEGVFMDARAEELERHFGGVVAMGIILVIVGALALAFNVQATMASVMWLGALLIVGGITQIVLAFSSRGFSGVALHLMLGLFSVVSGVLFLRAPLIGAEALTLVVSAWLLASGLGQTIHAVAERFPHRGM